MGTDIETKYCQTCGIPLDIDYNNLEVNTSTEYCDYCLKHGVKGYGFLDGLSDLSLGLFPKSIIKETGISYTSPEIRGNVKTTSRNKKVETKNQYSPRVYELIAWVQRIH